MSPPARPTQSQKKKVPPTHGTSWGAEAQEMERTGFEMNINDLM